MWHTKEENSPSVQGIQKGVSIDFINEDNIFLDLKKRRPFFQLYNKN